MSKAIGVMYVCIVSAGVPESSFIIRKTRQIIVLWNTAWNIATMTTMKSEIDERSMPR